MEPKTIVQILISTLVCGIILMAFVPIAVGVQTVASTEVNYENNSTMFKMAESEDVVTISLSNGTITLNGETVAQTSNSNVILSDVFSCDQFQYQGNWLTRSWYKDSTELSYPSAFSLTFEDGVVTGSITRGGTTDTIEDTYEYLYYASSSGNYCQKPGTSTIDAYVKSLDDLVLSGLYYTGENKTTYSYINGVLTLEGDYVGSVDIATEKVGMDVLRITNIVVHVGDESFTPFRYLVPTEVIGHTETPVSNIIGILPLIVVVGLLLTVVGAIFINRM